MNSEIEKELISHYSMILAHRIPGDVWYYVKPLIAQVKRHQKACENDCNGLYNKSEDQGEKVINRIEKRIKDILGEVPNIIIEFQHDPRGLTVKLNHKEVS